MALTYSSSYVQTQTLSDIALLSARPRRAKLDILSLLFLLSVLLAPIELLLVASLTVYDAVITVLAFLIIVGRRRIQFLPRKFMVAIYFFLLFALVSTFRATEPIESLTQILQFAFIFFVQLPVILTLIKSRFMVRMSLFLLLCGMFIGVVWAFVFNEVSGSGRTVTFYSSSPNRLGYPIAYLLPFVLYLLLDTWRRRHLLVVLVIALPLFYLMAWALAASGSRSAALGMLSGLVVFLTFRRGFEINLKIILRLVTAVTVIGSLSYWFYWSNYIPSTLRYRIEQTLLLEGSFIYERLDVALAGWRAFLTSPFIGVGLDNFRYVASEYVFTAGDQLPHNIWLQYLAQIGLFGALAFLTVMLGWFVLMLRTQRSTNNLSQRELQWAFIASMIAIMGIHMFVPQMLQRQYWLVYGLGLALVFISREDQEHSTSQFDTHPALFAPSEI